MKKGTIMLFLFSFLVASTASGFDFKKNIGGKTIYFTVLSGDSTVVVVAPGDSVGGWNAVPKPAGRLVIPSSVQYDGNRYQVVAVDDNAFLECDRLKAVTVPVSVSVLGNNAFGHCTSLTSITLECDSLAKAYNAFAGCDAVDTIVLAPSTRKMPAFLFSEMKSVGNVVLRSQHPETMRNLFFGCRAQAVLTVDASVATIPEFFCYNFTGLSSIVYDGPAPSLTAIGQYAFVGCTSLADIVFPSSLKHIGSGAFAHCTPRTLFFLSHLAPQTSGSSFAGVDRSTAVVVPCASLVSYATSAIGRHFEQLDYSDSCDDSISRLKIIYIHDTVIVRDTVFVVGDGAQRFAAQQQSKHHEAQSDIEETVAYDGDDEPWIFIDGKTLRIARATQMRGVGVRLFDEKGRLVVDERIPDNQPADNYYIRLPRRQRYFLRFDMGTPIVVDVDKQEIR